MQVPPPQASLEADYKRHLGASYGVVFNGLYTLANMPIQRFGSTLISKGQFNQYMRLLRDAHRADNLDGVMCRSILSVDWQGYVYDCDFNQMLGIPLVIPGKPRRHLSDLLHEDFAGAPIAAASCTMFKPTPPQPNTSTQSPGTTLPRRTTAWNGVVMASAMMEPASRGISGGRR